MKDKIGNDIREAFVLLKELGNYECGNVDLNKAIIITSYFSELSDQTEILGFTIYLCDLQSSFDYFICIPDANKIEEKWLRCHREAMEFNG